MRRSKTQERTTIVALGHSDVLRVDRWTGRIYFMALSVDTDWIELPLRSRTP